MTFCTYNEDVLRRLGSQLQSINSELIAAAQTENGLVVEQVTRNDQKRLANKRATEPLKETGNLPVPPKRIKNNRVGIAADKKRERVTQFLALETGKIGNNNCFNYLIFLPWNRNLTVDFQRL